MTRRVPPSSEQIAEAIRRGCTESDTRAVMLREACDAVRGAFRTTKQFARDWIETASMEERDSGPPVVVTYSRDGGSLGGVLTRNNGRWPTIDSERICAAWVERGLVDKAAAYATPHVDHVGRFIPAERRYNKATATGTPGALGGQTYVLLPEALSHLVARETADLHARLTVSDAEDVVERAAFDNEYGDAAAFIRGLLVYAGIANKGRRSNSRMRVSMVGLAPERQDGHVEITVVGSDIDLLASRLRLLGVEPVYPRGHEGSTS
jgi:hypothetical protein